MRERIRARQDSKVTVVRRRQRRGNGEVSESGAWKVAFADFTLAMMALFMVLWIVRPLGYSSDTDSASALLQPTTPIEGGEGIFEGSSRIPEEFAELRVPILLDELPGRLERDDVRGRYDAPAELAQLADLLDRVAAELDAVANLEIEVVPQGLRILIKDDEQRYMFERGSALLDPHFEGLLRTLGDVLKDIDNKFIVSGHTDAIAYPEGVTYDNWNLSADRALRARRELVHAGFSLDSVLQVTAQADIMPVRPDDPTHGANRRVELLILTASAEQLYRELFGETYTQVHYSDSSVELLPNGAPDLP